MRLVVALLLAIVAASTAQALTLRPDWIRTPSGDDILRLYPAKARAEGVTGTAVISCVVRPSGNLRECSVVRQEPSGWGFGEAALRLALVFRLRPPGEGAPPQRIDVPIRFSLPPDERP
jgi:periplasmic protein TonB